MEVSDPVSAKKNAIKNEISQVLKLIEDQPNFILPSPQITKREQQRDYLTERIDLLQ